MTDRLPPLALPDLTGRTALVTGGTSGLGLETATALARAGAHVTLTARDAQRGADAAGVVRAALGPGAGAGRVEVLDLDTSRFASVDGAVAAWGTRGLDMLVLNAGRNGGRVRHQTADGHERTMATNALGHLRLTHGLLPALRAAGGRVTTVGSLLAHRADPSASDVCLERGWTPARAYARSKLACLMIARELPGRAGAAAMAAHPGWTFTKILGTGRLMTATVDLSRRARVGQSPADGAQAIIAAAVGLSALGGGSGYLGPTGMLAGSVGAARPPRALADPALREAWWTALCEHAGVPTDWR